MTGKELYEKYCRATWLYARVRERSWGSLLNSEQRVWEELAKGI